jgi:hypothetical protein
MARKNKTQEREQAAAVRLSPRVEQTANEHKLPAHPALALKRVTGAPPSSLRLADVLTLQRAVGNRATQQILGAMLGQSGLSAPVQAKLTLGAAGDRYEQEADRVAAEVTRTPDSAQQPTVQRAADEGEKDLQMKSPVSHVAATGQSAVAPGLESAVGRARGGGQPLPVGLRARMERAFGADFSNVHVHTDARADGLNRSLEARAFTAGRDLFFRSGEYSPDSQKGQELIAHELTHVVQQGGGRGGSQAKHTSPVLQRKNLGQMNLAQGLTDENKTYELVGDGRKVKSYSEQASATATDKLAALNKAAEMNSIIGKRTEKETWTPKWVNLDDNSKNTLDPFFYKVVVPFKENNKDERIVLYFQHALLFTGYVESIFDSTNVSTTGFATMYPKENTPQDKTRKYSNVHAKTKAAKLIDLTTGKEEKHFDAYTKIVGEGARWQCVRNHAAKLQDDSIFYVKQNNNPNDTKGWGVTFGNLWLTWTSSFGKEYNIPDKTVATKLLSNEVFTLDKLTKAKKFKRYEVPDITKMTANDYEVKP